MKQNVLIGIIAVAALAIGLMLSLYVAPPQPSSPTYMQLYPQARTLPDFSLYDHQGQTFDKSRLKDRWTLAFVGYTYCPDICPTTLAELKRVYPELKTIESEYPLQVWFLSVDPKRDTQERLNEYIQFFNSEFVAASGEHKDLFPLVRGMGMMYAIADNTSDPNYLVDHSASVVVIDPEANVIGRFKPDLKPGELAISDGTQILADLPLVMSP